MKKEHIIQVKLKIDKIERDVIIYGILKKSKKTKTLEYQITKDKTKFDIKESYETKTNLYKLGFAIKHPDDEQDATLGMSIAKTRALTYPFNEVEFKYGDCISEDVLTSILFASVKKLEKIFKREVLTNI